MVKMEESMDIKIIDVKKQDEDYTKDFQNKDGEKFYANAFAYSATINGTKDMAPSDWKLPHHVSGHPDTPHAELPIDRRLLGAATDCIRYVLGERFSPRLGKLLI